MKKICKENFRVIIEPRYLGDYGYFIITDRRNFDIQSKEYEERCNDIISDCKRHVDSIGHIYMEYDEKEYCEFCGNEWEECTEPDEDWELGEPVCCGDAQKEFKRLKDAGNNTGQ